MMDVVFIEEHPIQGAERRVRAGTTVGRAEAAVPLTDPEVSRLHAVFRQVDAGIAVEDLGSRNGTYVNDRRIEGITTLTNGDRVRFGNTIWRLEEPGGRTGAGAERATANGEPDQVPTWLNQ